MDAIYSLKSLNVPENSYQNKNNSFLISYKFIRTLLIAFYLNTVCELFKYMINRIDLLRLI